MSIEWIQFGASLSSFLNLNWFPNRDHKHIGQTAAIIDFFPKDSRADKDTLKTCSLLKKIISRGKTPLVDFSLEEKIAELSQISIFEKEKGWKDWNFKKSDFGKYDSDHFKSMVIEFIWKNSKENELNVDSRFFHGCFDSKREKKFFSDWIPKNLGKKAFGFIVPQARIKDLGLGKDV